MRDLRLRGQRRRGLRGLGLRCLRIQEVLDSEVGVRDVVDLVVVVGDQ